VKTILYFFIGALSSLLALIGIARLRRFILEPDYIPVRCDGGGKA